MIIRFIARLICASRFTEISQIHPTLFSRSCTAIRVPAKCRKGADKVPLKCRISADNRPKAANLQLHSWESFHRSPY
nr:MAG TPA: hypothetical protein [Caudoviricetes sp.]